MKRIIAVLLCIFMLTPVFFGCAKIKQDAEDKGAEIPVYVSSEIYTLDPAFAYIDEAATKILGLIYEGLFTMDAKGNVQKTLCKSYTTGHNRDGEFFMEITLNDTKWSDGRSVTANDFVYAWKRILEPEFTSEAASMLFDIKNARACKEGLISIDDLGVVASETAVLEITFEKDIDIDLFIEYLCSPALVPLREDKAGRLADWATYYATTVTNGPFYPKLFEPGTGSMSLERNIYYYRDMESETQKLDVYVTPYQINISFCTPEEALNLYNEGSMLYNSDLPITSRGEYKDKVTTQNTLSTASYYFNTTKAPFDKVEVRQALSLAIDREELANLVVYAKPAQGIVPEGVFNTDNKTSFRKEGGSLIEAKANVEQAKELLKKAGVSGGEFTIKIRDNETDKTIADYVKGVWEQLGFKVTVEPLSFKYYTNIDYNQYHDLLREAYFSGDFDVIAIDMLALSTQAFQTLACFAKDFSGVAMDLSGQGINEESTTLPIREAPETSGEESEGGAADELGGVKSVLGKNVETTIAESKKEETTVETTTKEETTVETTTAETTVQESETAENEAEVTTGDADAETVAPEEETERTFETVPHLTGFNNDEYNKLIEDAFNAESRKERAELLHKAESLLIEQMPVIPLFVYQDAYLISKDLSKVGTDYYAVRDFKKTELKDYQRFKKVAEE